MSVYEVSLEQESMSSGNIISWLNAPLNQIAEPISSNIGILPHLTRENYTAESLVGTLIGTVSQVASSTQITKSIQYTIAVNQIGVGVQDIHFMFGFEWDSFLFSEWDSFTFEEWLHSTDVANLYVGTLAQVAIDSQIIGVLKSVTGTINEVNDTEHQYIISYLTNNSGTNGTNGTNGWDIFTYDDWESFTFDEWTGFTQEGHEVVIIPIDGVRYPATQVSKTDYQLTQKSTMTLAYNGTTVTVRAPEFNNSQELNCQRIIRETRGRVIKAYTKTIWPKTELLKMRCIILSPTTRDEFFTFVKASLGQLITLVDYENRTWQGILSNPNGISVEQYRYNGYTIEFEFEGALI